MRRRLILVLGTAGLVAGLAPSLFPAAPRVVWNATASAPQGLYGLRETGPLRVGQRVAVAPPAALAAWLDQRGAAPRGVLLVKTVAALAPSTICRAGRRVTVDGAWAATAQRRDRQGRLLPVWTGCRRLSADQVFLLNDAAGSLDGRYLGPLPVGAVVGQVTPIWIVRAAAHAG